jgi:hypothetical protein
LPVYTKRTKKKTFVAGFCDRSWFHLFQKINFFSEQMLDIPDQRLLFRKYVWNFDPHPSTTVFSWCLNCGMVSIATCQRWSDCGSQCSTIWYRFMMSSLDFVDPLSTAHCGCLPMVWLGCVRWVTRQWSTYLVWCSTLK